LLSVFQLLVKNPNKRLTLDQVLQHAWITGNAPSWKAKLDAEAKNDEAPK
jgi:hypothetical protein